MLAVLTKLLYLLTLGPFQSEGTLFHNGTAGEKLGHGEEYRLNSPDDGIEQNSKSSPEPKLTVWRSGGQDSRLELGKEKMWSQASRLPSNLLRRRRMAELSRSRRRITEDLDLDHYDEEPISDDDGPVKIRTVNKDSKLKDGQIVDTDTAVEKIPLELDPKQMQSFKMYRDLTIVLLIHSTVLAFFSTWEYFRNRSLKEWQAYYSYYGNKVAAFYWLSSLMFIYAHLLTEEGDLYMIKVWTILGGASFIAAFALIIMGHEEYDEAVKKTNDITSTPSSNTFSNPLDFSLL